LNHLIKIEGLPIFLDVKTWLQCIQFYRYTNIVALTLQICSKFHDYKLWLWKCLIIIILTIVTKLCSTISTMYEYEYTSTKTSTIHICNASRWVYHISLLPLCSFQQVRRNKRAKNNEKTRKERGLNMSVDIFDQSIHLINLTRFLVLVLLNFI
jgi:hypothetical protein